MPNSLDSSFALTLFERSWSNYICQPNDKLDIRSPIPLYCRWPCIVQTCTTNC